MQAWGKETVAKFYGGALHLRVSGDRSLDDHIIQLNEIIQRGQDMRPVMQLIDKYLTGAVKRTFEAEGRPRKWKPLQRMTILDRARKGYPPGPILRRTDTLMNSLTQDGAAYEFHKVGARSVQRGSKVVYFRTHQYGYPQRNVPARVMLVLERQDVAQMRKMIAEFVRTGKA